MQLRRVQVLFTLVGIAEASILPFLPIVLQDRGLSAAEIGVVLSVAALAGFVSTPLWGHAADGRLGAEHALVVASIAAAVAAMPLALAHSLLALTIVVVLITGARSAMASLTDAIALEHLGDDRAQYGRVRLWLSLGWAISACVWGLALQWGSLGWLPWIYVACVLLVAFAAYAVGGGRTLHDRSPAGTRRAMLIALAPFLVSLLLLFAAFNATFSFISLRIRDLGGGLFVVGAATALQALAEAPVMRITPRLNRVLGHRALYVVGSLFFIVSFVAWAFLDDPLAIALVKLVAGIGFALVYVGSVLLVDDLVPAALRGTGQGLAKAVTFGLSPILGSLAGGAIYDYAGPRALFLACAGAALVAAGSVSVIAARGRATRVSPT
ncbi:MAG: transporter, family, 3-phenylpropionic acid transporter [Gaiellaceae bacterium]|nr:transporter, family, 3-phenylpropionic acid transporter [Gaiellaceae bacterium]